MTTTPLVSAADDAVMIIHELNRQTRHEHAITEPAELAQLLASLTALTAGLPQLLGQLQRWLTDQHAHQQVQATGDLAADHLVAAATCHLARARRIAHDLTATLDAAHQPTTDLNAQPARQHTSTETQGVSFHP